jgi:hypothetical protein
MLQTVLTQVDSEGKPVPTDVPDTPQSEAKQTVLNNWTDGEGPDAVEQNETRVDAEAAKLKAEAKALAKKPVESKA